VNARRNVPSVDGAGIQPPSSPARASRPQHVAVIDTVGAQNHREHERHDLAARVRSPRPIAPQPHQIPRERLHAETLGERRDEHHPGVRNDALIIKNDVDPVQSDRPVIVHHEGDLPLQAPAAVNSRKSPALEVILVAVQSRGLGGAGSDQGWEGAAVLVGGEELAEVVVQRPAL
jgi:hypothetical protein